jgi:hypothetical protein
VVAGFRYGSLLEKRETENRNVLHQHVRGVLGEQLLAAGRALWHGIPEEMRTGVVYTVDAVVDSQDKLWLLEMNANPGLHPDAYPAMLAAVLKGKVSGMPSLAHWSERDLPARKGGTVWAPRPRRVPAA